MDNNVVIVGVFESWYNGGIQTSSLYLSSIDGQDVVDAFIEGNKRSFAELHLFDSEEEAKNFFEKISNDNIR